MDKPIYKVMKVFDCQWDPGMPKKVKDAFFSLHEECGNDVYVSWEVQWDDKDYFTSQEDWAIKRRLIDDWLMQNGAAGRTSDSPYHGEEVLIKHWW